jgi:hypothetical protein
LFLGADQPQKRKTKYADTYICLEFLQILSKKSVSTLKEHGSDVRALLQESIKNVSAEVRLPHTQKSSPELVRDFVNFALDQFHNRPSEGESEGSTATPPLPVILRDPAKLPVTLSELMKGQHRHMAGMGKAFLTYKKNETDNFHTLLLFWEEGALFLIDPLASRNFGHEQVFFQAMQCVGLDQASLTICQNPAEVEDFLAIRLPDYALPGWQVLLWHQQACGVSEMDIAGGPAEAGGLIQKGPTNIWGGVSVTSAVAGMDVGGAIRVPGPEASMERGAVSPAGVGAAGAVTVAVKAGVEARVGPREGPLGEEKTLGE